MGSGPGCLSSFPHRSSLVASSLSANQLSDHVEETGKAFFEVGKCSLGPCFRDDLLSLRKQRSQAYPLFLRGPCSTFASPWLDLFQAGARKKCQVSKRRYAAFWSTEVNWLPRPYGFQCFEVLGFEPHVGRKTHLKHKLYDIFSWPVCRACLRTRDDLELRRIVTRLLLALKFWRPSCREHVTMHILLPILQPSNSLDGRLAPPIDPS